MKITKLHLKDFQQFKDLTLDFTHPETEEPLDRVCFIGSNGTGKTTILETLNAIVTHTLTKEKYEIAKSNQIKEDYEKFAKIEIQILHNENLFKLNKFLDSFGLIYFQEINEIKENFFHSKSLSAKLLDFNELPVFVSFLEKEVEINLMFQTINKIQKNNNSLSFVKGENTVFNQEHPSSTLNEALELFKEFPITNEISNATISDFWQKLIYNIKKRENDRAAFENAEENLNKTKRELIEEFDKNEPNILEKLAELWNNILAKSNLYFDYENANNPIQLTDNLTAYIKSKTTNETITYNKLSTGIKNFIFQLGHLKAIHFNRKIDNSFLLVDEPSQGLYPDFVYDLVEMYESVVSPDTQIFMATHNPIVAAQFHPYERFILSFDETGYVTVKRGVSPIGDDPNDILNDDFLVENLMPKQGLEAWQRYKDLKREIHFLSKKQPQNGERETLDALIKEMSDLGSKYHF